jgi:hypothetical protein
MHMPVAVIPLSLWFFALLPVLVLGMVSMVALVTGSLYLILTPAGSTDGGSQSEDPVLDPPDAESLEVPRAA